MSKTPKAPWQLSQARHNKDGTWTFHLEREGFQAVITGSDFPTAENGRRVARLICQALNGPKPTPKPRKERTK
jgi:hypothetical protein